MLNRHTILILALPALALAGCLSPVQRDVDALVCKSASVATDLQAPSVPPSDIKEPPIDQKNMLDRLRVPKALPGSETPKLEWPKDWLQLGAKEREAVIARFFHQQFDVGMDPAAVPGPNGHPLTLTDLQKMAREHSPLLRQAAADITAAEGAARQAGLYNNPVVGWTSTPVSFTSGNTYGPSFSQTIPTMGKRKLAEAAATVDIANAQLAFRRAQTDLMASVRSAYFAVLVAEEGMRANRGLMELTDQLYKVTLLQVKGGVMAGYEPAQIGVFAGQARVAYIQSRNSYMQSWKNLAGALGLPMMPVTELSGSLSKNLPRFDFDKALGHILREHTDAVTARNGIDKARINLRLAEVTGVPDVTVGATILYDDSPPGPPRWVPFFMGTMPIPVFDRNQGGIRQAQGALMRANEEPHRVQAALTISLADAFRRQEENRQLLYMYRKQLLPQQVQAFRGTLKRHFSAGGPEPVPGGGTTAYMSDLIGAEQNLVSLIASYLTVLQLYWQSVSDTASLLQTDDVYKMSEEVANLPDADLNDMLKLPCCHPCSSLSCVTPVEPAPRMEPVLTPVPPEPAMQPAVPSAVAPTPTVPTTLPEMTPSTDPLSVFRPATVSAPVLLLESESDAVKGGSR